VTVPSVLITGANRGLGLEQSRQYAADGRHFFAYRRDPSPTDDNAGAVSLHALDVTCHGRSNPPARAVIDPPHLDDSCKFLSYYVYLIPW
jgi:NAD(P)-dependent dehydrogenase (short-subunit alcohol dehydrogenase family)